MSGPSRLPHIRLCAALLLCNLVFIWGNSLLDGQISGGISEFVRSILCRLFPAAQSHGSGHVLRKMAHFAEFACLGALLRRLFYLLRFPHIPGVALPLLCGALAACVDEWIQLFVPGRCSSPLDVALDTSGVLAGIGCMVLGQAIHNKQNKFQEETNK